jgi:hypothetical protein
MEVLMAVVGVRPVAARAELGLEACAQPGSDWDRERCELARAFTTPPACAAGEGEAAIQTFAPIHEPRIGPDCRCNTPANLSYFETGQRPE